MAVAETDTKGPFSLDSYHVSEELGFILPEPLVGGKAFLLFFYENAKTFYAGSHNDSDCQEAVGVKVLLKLGL